MQKAADTLQSVADMYDDHARRTQLVTHEALKGVSHPYTTYAVCHSCYGQESPNIQLKCFLAYHRYSRFHRDSVSRRPGFHLRSTRGDRHAMRNGVEYDDGGDGDLPFSED